MDNDQIEIERCLLPFQEACRREGYNVQCCLIPVPNPDHELFRDRPIGFQLKVIEPKIRERHYVDTWILFRRLLRETVAKPIRERFRDFNIYPTIEDSHHPLPPIPNSETTELFNRFLYLFHWAFVDIRNLSYSKDGKTMSTINKIADAIHEIPHDMFFWGYGNDGTNFSTLDFVYSCLESLEEEQETSEETGQVYQYLHFLEMPYGQFVRERLRSYNGRETGIVFDPNRSQMGMATSMTTVLYRPVGPAELSLIESSGWTRFPPRLPEQPIFYPVLNEEYATEITRKWNIPESGVGYVTRFRVQGDYLARFPVKTVGGKIHAELWVPAEELEEFNNHIVGQIEVIAEYRDEGIFHSKSEV